DLLPAVVDPSLVHERARLELRERCVAGAARAVRSRLRAVVARTSDEEHGEQRGAREGHAVVIAEIRCCGEAERTTWTTREPAAKSCTASFFGWMPASARHMTQSTVSATLPTANAVTSACISEACEARERIAKRSSCPRVARMTIATRIGSQDATARR